MKCPKCSYLGFETGDRCKNCGYDFSLMAAPAEPPDPDLNLYVPDDLPGQADRSWIDRLHSGVEDVAEAHEMPEATLAAPSSTFAIDPPPPAARGESAFPLFDPRADEDDEPLIKLPASPRPPLSVRRTPEPPRFRSLGRPDDPPLALEFSEETLVSPGAAMRSPIGPFAPIAPIAVESLDDRVHGAADAAVSSLPRRAAAGLTDLVILFAIDLIVLYSTLRMAGLAMNDWSQLPPVPMLAFLVLLKLSYFVGFTAACGQTIGKMAAHIRVVSDDAPLDPGRAIRRTLMSAVSLVAFGAGFIPALLDPDHRALHDRVARTRVVELPLG
jgi:uncharacterized RDD family membrane protein YckC